MTIVLLALVMTAPTPSKMGLGAAAKIGVLIPTNELRTTYVVGIEVHERFPVLRRMLGISAELSYFEPRLSGGGSSPAVSGVYSYDIAARALQLTIDALFFLPLSLPVDLYAGLGYSASFYAVTSQAFGTRSAEIETRHGLRARIGVLWPFWGPLYASLEALYHYAAFDFLITGVSNAGAVMVNANFGFEI